MKVKLLRPVAGDNFSKRSGDFMEVSAATAAAWIAEGVAEKPTTQETLSADVKTLHSEREAMQAEADALGDALSGARQALGAALGG